MLSTPLVFCSSASAPTAVLKVPLVLACSAAVPKAVLAVPFVLACSAPTPTAVLLLPLCVGLPAVPAKKLPVPPLVFPELTNWDALRFVSPVPVPVKTELMMVTLVREVPAARRVAVPADSA